MDGAVTSTAAEEATRYVPEYLVAVPCPDCGGTGHKPEFWNHLDARWDAEDCDTCGGNG